MRKSNSDNKSKSNTSRSNRGTRNYKGRRPKNQNRKENLKQVSDEELSNASNEPEFYFVYPELMKHVTNIPFNVIANLPAPLSGNGTFSFPNVVTLEIEQISPCTPTASSQRNTNMNQFMQDFYAAVRRENSGARNYDPADLTRFIFAMAEVFKRINYLQRFYYMMNYYSPLNRAFPIMLFNMMGMDYNSFRDNQAEFAARLDTLITRASTMFVPSDIMILKRIAMMFANYYIDTNDSRDTIYIPVPSRKGNIAGSFLKLDATENLVIDDGGVKTGSTLTTMNDIMTSAENYVDQVLASQDFGIMQGDILKAFPNANYTRLQNLDPSVRLAPIYDKAMLMQYHNADVLGTSYYASGQGINSPWLGFDSNGLPIGMYNPSADIYKCNDVMPEKSSMMVGKDPNGYTIRSEAYLCLDEETTSPEWIVECTRMKAECGVDTIGNVHVFMAIDADFVDDMAANWGVTLNDAEIAAHKGSFPYLAVCAGGTNYMQHVTALNWLNPGQYTAHWTTAVNPQDPMEFLGSSIKRGVWGIPNVWLMTIARYLPYRIMGMRWIKNAADANTKMPYASTNGPIPWTVITPMPIIQPLDIPNLKRIDNVCWRSLLSWKR